MVSILPESPLFLIKLNKFNKNENFNKEGFKMYDVIYSLMDSRDLKVIYKELSVKIQMPINMYIKFTF